MKVLFTSLTEQTAVWLPLLQQALPRDTFTLLPAKDVDIALVGTHGPGTFEKLGRPKLIQALWMGVETLIADPSRPRDIPLARMVDPGMVAAMSETVLAYVLDWHRHFYRYRQLQQARDWEQLPQFLAAERSIGILGLGELGAAAATKLAALGFKVLGWSRRPKQMAGVECFTDLEQMLPMCDALVCLLPLTAQTRGILNKTTLGAMRRGGCVINLARGGHLVVKDLIAALDSGRLAHAYLDVFEHEPLPARDAAWTHPGITITPHIAARTEPRTAVAKIAENIERVRRGETPLHLVDFSAGY